MTVSQLKTEDLVDFHNNNFPVASDLNVAVFNADLSAVFRILARWQLSRPALDQEGNIFPALTASAKSIALSRNRPDILSLLLSMNTPKSLPIKEAIRAGHVANFDVFLWHGWDVNEPVEMDGPAALGYADSE